MATQLGRLILRATSELRFEPVAKRVRATLGGEVVADTTRAVLVWEPGRNVPAYAVPVGDVRCEVVPIVGAHDVAAARRALAPGGYGPFALHTTEGEACTLRVGDVERVGAGFRPADADLAGYLVLDFDAMDAWREEDDEVRGHPRDPFHRVDVRRSSRRVRVELAGTLLAESARPSVVFETKLPPRFYLPREDVRMELLRATTTRTTCAYKGDASYWSVALPDRVVEDLAWSYERPLPDAVELAGLLCFYDERVDVTVDRVRRERPKTAWSERST